VKKECTQCDRRQNANVQRILENLHEVDLSGIGAVFEHKDLRLNNISDPLSGMRKLVATRERRLATYGNKMSDKQREFLIDELSSMQDAIDVLDDQKYEIWGLIYSYLKQLPKGLSAAIITLPLSMSGKGIATIDLINRKALICVYPEGADRG